MSYKETTLYAGVSSKIVVMGMGSVATSDCSDWLCQFGRAGCLPHCPSTEGYELLLMLMEIMMDFSEDLKK